MEVAILMIGAGLLLFYFLPTFVAVWVKHQNATAIFVLNFLAGWTFIGWVAALVIAVWRSESHTSPSDPSVSYDVELLAIEDEGRATNAVSDAVDIWREDAARIVRGPLPVVVLSHVSASRAEAAERMLTQAQCRVRIVRVSELSPTAGSRSSS